MGSLGTQTEGECPQAQKQHISELEKMVEEREEEIDELMAEVKRLQEATE